jgi:hypothetical protein
MIGGITIVFDSAPQFVAMLRDSLPREASGEPVEGCFAVFLDAQARIIASTTSNYRVGDQGFRTRNAWLTSPHKLRGN